MLAEFIDLEFHLVAVGPDDGLPGQIDPQPIAWRGFGFPKEFVNNISIQNNG